MRRHLFLAANNDCGAPPRSLAGSLSPSLRSPFFPMHSPAKRNKRRRRKVDSEESKEGKRACQKKERGESFWLSRRVSWRKKQEKRGHELPTAARDRLHWLILWARPDYQAAENLPSDETMRRMMKAPNARVVHTTTTPGNIG